MPKEDANQLFRQIKTTNPDLADKIKSAAEEDKKGIEPVDRRMKKMGVKNGERAQHIFKQTQKLETREEKNAYIKDLRRKGVITDEVMKQLKLLVRNQNVN